MDITLWSIRWATLFYVLALWQWINGGSRGRLFWTIGCGLFLIHVAAAFHYRHHWSHDAALRETARQTRETLGIESGGGIYWNYAFALIWLGDALWGMRTKPDWLLWTVHGFMGFMFFNGAVVFASGPMRWLALAGMLALGAEWLRATRRARS